MAKLLVIGSKTARTGTSKKGDVVAVFDDHHEFSDAEKASFDVVALAGTAGDVLAKLHALTPKTSKGKAKEKNPPKYLFAVKDKTKTKVETACECRWK